LDHIFTLAVRGRLDQAYVENRVAPAGFRIENSVPHALALLAHLEDLEGLLYCLDLHFCDSVDEHVTIGILTNDFALQSPVENTFFIRCH